MRLKSTGEAAALSSTNLRVFSAVYPSMAAREHLATLLRSSTTDTCLRWQSSDTWHITCQFYGRIPLNTVEEISGYLAESLSTVAPFRLALQGAGHFQQRCLWIGVGEGSHAMSECMQRSLLPGTTAEHDPRPHLTVARCPRTPQVDRRHQQPPHAESVLTGLAADFTSYVGPCFLVDRVHLMASELGAAPGVPARHTLISEIPLGQKLPRLTSIGQAGR
ncbi:RNA 2',3'-cyclic phosphodiesterase [Corynebacterium ciconiae]|uniref:RNA 2',3'-cyclic phosphodiesterase n=1 Tax=Corynebacterium ciconiae TaxID=227319 RepID=UPI003431C727